MSGRLADGAPAVAVLQVSGSARPEVTRAVVITTLLRSALQRRFDGDRTGRRSPTLSGHDADGPSTRQHRHAHYFALPDATGRVDRLAVWAPDGLSPAELQAVSGLVRLTLRELAEPLRVAMIATGRPQQTLAGFSAPAPTWDTVTPVVLPRHVKRGRDRDSAREQILREIAHRGLPVPEQIEDVEGAWDRFARDRPGHRIHAGKSAVGVRLRFAEPVAGPIALGANSHFGMGLMRPCL